MENSTDTVHNSKNSENANNPAHYTLMIVGIIVVNIGTFLRFIGNWTFVDILSNIIFVIGVIICLKSVTNILK
ncbi:MAG TPA: hypothetical protein VF602_01935 [Pedobacter sp.]|jgi:uncharacterized protein (DUF983 family)